MDGHPLVPDHPSMRAAPGLLALTLLADLPPRPTPAPSTSLQSDWGYNLGSNNWRGPSGHILGKAIDPLMGRKW